MLEQSSGRIRRFLAADDASEVEDVLSLQVRAALDDETQELGLLGMAFDPAFERNGQIYVFYNPSDEPLRSVVERYTSRDGGRSFDPASRLLLLSILKPSPIHHGGSLAFSPRDGYLYVSVGDGNMFDAYCFAQDAAELQGKILRIDVRSSSPREPYAIPDDNPYVRGGGRPEIWALGLRNPWRFSFDRETGELWVGDVGQDKFEEINLIERGKNYGWNSKEGFACTESRTCVQTPVYPGRALPTLPACQDPGLTDPVHAYGRDEGVTVIGGFVYRGSRLQDRVGTYLYADASNGRVYGLTRNGSTFTSQVLIDSDLYISAFGEDPDGELYVLDYYAGTVYRLAARAEGPANELPTRLSQTGCFDPADPTSPLPALIPYQVRVSFWSDGADKERWLALPDETQLSVQPDGHMVIPPRALTIKTFWLANHRVETRFFVRWADGSYGGYSYLWNDEQTEATLLPEGGETHQVGGAPWYFPSRAECDRCHTPAAGYILGLETMQLDKDLSYASGKRANQLDTLTHVGMLPNVRTMSTLNPSALNPLPAPEESASSEAHARAYLHVNCSPCHRPGGAGLGSMDLRISGPSSSFCMTEPTQGDLGAPEARILTPGRPNDSLLFLRASRRGEGAMPPLASEQVDADGQKVLERWIESMGGCP